MSRKMGWWDLNGPMACIVLWYAIGGTAMGLLGAYGRHANATSQIGEVTTASRDVPRPAAHEPVEATVLRVVDGDTIEVRRKIDPIDRKVKVRLLLVDCPEQAQHPWGAAAKLWTTVELAGKEIVLEYDTAKPDPYGRDLCYVFYTNSAGKRRLFNEDLIRAGWAFYYDPGPKLRYTDVAKAAEAAAAKAKAGVHKEGECPLKVPSEFRKAKKAG